MGKNKHVQQVSKKRPSLFPVPSENTEREQDESSTPKPTSKHIVKGKQHSKLNRENLDEYQVENMILRITLPQAVKILTPVAAFVICNHACKFNAQFVLICLFRYLFGNSGTFRI